jgi:primosomal protein N' (replication factor Y) (superfamily II helicase)
VEAAKGGKARPAIIRVAIDAPLPTLFDYAAPAQGPVARPGCRVRVPFGRRETVGVVFEHAAGSGLDPARLRAATVCLDPEPLISSADLDLLKRVSAYYHHPIGEVVATALPASIRRGVGAGRPQQPERHWQLTPSGEAATPRNAPRQAALLACLRDAGGRASESRLREAGAGLPRTLVLLQGHGWIEPVEDATQPEAKHSCTGPVARGGTEPTTRGADVAPVPSQAQQTVLEEILAARGRHAVHLLEGVTGSGKTEVYLRLITTLLAEGRQSLLLVPEIALSDQTLQALASRIPARVALLHSALGDAARAQAWRAAATGDARVVLGTRSAVWTPLPDLGLVIVDEEHDTSYKQGEGLRYSARDVAVLRAQLAGVPVVLGSATPSLETWANAGRGRYRHLRMPERVGLHPQPRIEVADIRGQQLDGGLGPTLLLALERALEAGDQCLLFLNRRGYAPVLMCHACGWTAICSRCDTRMTWHREDGRLRCHHCLGQQRVPVRCPGCQGEAPSAVGQGTERITEVLERRFPRVMTLRVDTDSTRAAGALARCLTAIREGHARILVGTQMLAKGHHFPGLALVGVVDTDDRLYSSDFRARERLVQLLLQVAGRCGRGQQPGRVIVQTHHPEHALFTSVVSGNYAAFADAELREREQLRLPPTIPVAMLRAEAVVEGQALDFLAAAQAQLGAPEGLRILGPVPSAMPRRAGRHRAQLWLEADARAQLHRALADWIPRVGQLKLGRRVRWALDVDPQDVL